MAFQAELYGKRRRGGRGRGKQRMVLQQRRKCMRMRLVDKLVAIPSIFRFPEFQTIAVTSVPTCRDARCNGTPFVPEARILLSPLEYRHAQENTTTARILLFGINVVQRAQNVR